MIGQFNAKNQEKKDSDQEVEKPINGSETKGNIQHQKIRQKTLAGLGDRDFTKMKNFQ